MRKRDAGKRLVRVVGCGWFELELVRRAGEGAEEMRDARDAIGEV